jgi:hypothetical protein
MKTTLDISDALLDEARAIAARERVTLRALVEQGLRHVVKEKKRKAKFVLRDMAFEGKGLRPDITDAGWERIRDIAYGELRD